MYPLSTIDWTSYKHDPVHLGFVLESGQISDNTFLVLNIAAAAFVREQLFFDVSTVRGGSHST